MHIDSLPERFLPIFEAACAKLDEQGVRLSSEERLNLFDLVIEGSRYISRRYLHWEHEIVDVEQIDVGAEKSCPHCLALQAILGESSDQCRLPERQRYSLGFAVELSEADRPEKILTLNVFWKFMIGYLKVGA